MLPVILSVNDYNLWLDPGFESNDFKEMLRPYEASLMKRYTVSTRVNLVKNDDAACATEVEEKLVTV